MCVCVCVCVCVCFLFNRTDTSLLPILLLIHSSLRKSRLSSG